MSSRFRKGAALIREVGGISDLYWWAQKLCVGFPPRAQFGGHRRCLKVEVRELLKNIVALCGLCIVWQCKQCLVHDHVCACVFGSVCAK